MRVVRPSSRAEMDYRWLKSEAWKLDAEAEQLVQDPDLSSSDLNRARFDKLRSLRSPIVDEFPADANYHVVEIDQSDLPNLFVIPIWDWYLDTGRTFQLMQTLVHLAPGRKAVDPLTHEERPIGHYDEVETKQAFIRTENPERSEEYLILVATSVEGPFTIVDGNHRAAALLRESEEAENFPWQAILLESPSVGSCKWHIESPGAQQHLRDCETAVGTGELQ